MVVRAWIFSLDAGSRENIASTLQKSSRASSRQRLLNFIRGMAKFSFVFTSNESYEEKASNEDDAMEKAWIDFYADVKDALNGRSLEDMFSIDESGEDDEDEDD